MGVSVSLFFSHFFFDLLVFFAWRDPTLSLLESSFLSLSLLFFAWCKGTSSLIPICMYLMYVHFMSSREGRGHQGSRQVGNDDIPKNGFMRTRTRLYDGAFTSLQFPWFDVMWRSRFVVILLLVRVSLAVNETWLVEAIQMISFPPFPIPNINASTQTNQASRGYS
ncbi:hypothetical protein J3F83DRAFT_235562 [Trichoderma novae-zelandiae]